MLAGLPPRVYGGSAESEYAPAEGASHAVQVQLGVSQYMKGYTGVFRKEVVLGTGYRVPIKFLTAEDKPVEVLHLTGVLVDASGQPVRSTRTSAGACCRKLDAPNCRAHPLHSTSHPTTCSRR